MIRLRRSALVAVAASLTWCALWPGVAASSGACPLPLGREVEAVRAFAKMMPVFRHPRCANCHGDFDILSEQHTGAASARSSGLDPRGLLTAPQRKALHAGCDCCHDNSRGAMTRLDGTQLSGWLVALQPMLWNGKSDVELCKQIKQFDRTGREFIVQVAGTLAGLGSQPLKKAVRSLGTSSPNGSP